MNFWMIFQVFGIVSAWAAKALQDGKITLIEAAELAAQLGALLGIPTNVTIPNAEAIELQPPKSAGEEFAATESAEPKTPLHGPAGEDGAAT